MGNRPVMEVTTGLAGEFLGLRYKSGSVVPWALDLTVWGGHRQRERNGAGLGERRINILCRYILWYVFEFYIHIIFTISYFVTQYVSQQQQ